MRMLVTGAAGAIGTRLTAHFETTGFKVVPVDIVRRNGIVYADLRDQETVHRLFETYSPDIVLHLAALKDLNYCQQHKTQSHASNYGITEHLVEACEQSATCLLYLSSDYVFGARDCYWTEMDPTCPNTQYGVDKSESERVIQERLSDFAIIRSAQLYGLAGDFVDLVCRTLGSGKDFSAFSNLVNCPTWVGDLIAMLDRIIASRHQGIFHCVGPEPKTRYQYACSIAEAYQLDKTLIKPDEIDFEIDIRPPVVRLDGASTYNLLRYYPGRLEDNLPLTD